MLLKLDHKGSKMLKWLKELMCKNVAFERMSLVHWMQVYVEISGLAIQWGIGYMLIHSKHSKKCKPSQGICKLMAYLMRWALREALVLIEGLITSKRTS